VTGLVGAVIEWSEHALGIDCHLEVSALAAAVVIFQHLVLVCVRAGAINVSRFAGARCDVATSDERTSEVVDVFSVRQFCGVFIDCGVGQFHSLAVELPCLGFTEIILLLHLCCSLMNYPDQFLEKAESVGW
jgi:hypothetical protein